MERELLRLGEEDLLRLGEEDLLIKVAETWRGLHHHTAVSVYLALVSSLPCPCTHMHTGENLYQNVLITWGETVNTCRGTAETWRGGAETWGGAGETGEKLLIIGEDLLRLGEEELLRLGEEELLRLGETRRSCCDLERRSY